MVEEHEVVDAILSGFDSRAKLSDGGDKAYLRAGTGTVDYLLGTHPGPAEYRCTPDQPCVKHRFLGHVRRLRSLFPMCAPSPESTAIQDDVAFFEQVRTVTGKIEGSEWWSGPDAEVETAIRQLVSEAMTGAGVIDIYAEAGIGKPDLALIDQETVRLSLTLSRIEVFRE